MTIIRRYALPTQKLLAYLSFQEKAPFTHVQQILYHDSYTHSKPIVHDSYIPQKLSLSGDLEGLRNCHIEAVAKPGRCASRTSAVTRDA